MLCVGGAALCVYMHVCLGVGLFVYLSKSRALEPVWAALKGEKD